MDDEKEIKKLPFHNFCVSIGALPTTYIESMTTAELLHWLCNYLEKTVIPTLNNNGDVVTELQTLFTELKTYCEHYFDNLDVQTEINNKLDALVVNGTLEKLLQPYLNEKVSQQNIKISQIENKINSIASGSPSGVYDSLESLQNTNPDHSKIYVVSANGNWYYYDTTSQNWKSGGTYQATEISNNSIDILELSKTLQDKFILNFNSPIIPDLYITGFCKSDNNKLVIEGNNNYQYFKVPLIKGNVYCFTGYNSYALNGLVIADNDNNVIYSSKDNNSEYYSPKGYLFNVKQDNLTAYISKSLQANPEFDMVYFRELLSLYVNKNKISTPKLIKSFDKKYIDYLSVSQGYPYIIRDTIEGHKVDVYEISKGISYHIEGYSHANALCFILTDIENKVYYYSDNDKKEEYTKINYDFTAEKDGFLYITNINNYDYIFQILNNEEKEIISNLTNKTIIYDGDSICENRSNKSQLFYNGGAYPKIIADITNGKYVNQAVGGATIVSREQGHSVVDNLINLPKNGDIYCFEGGANDYFQSKELGEFKPYDYTYELNTNKFYDALEQIFRYSLANFLGKPICFVIQHKMINYFNNNSLNLKFNDYVSAIINVCNKYSIPYFNAFDKSGLNGMITEQKNNFLTASMSGTADGLHPNENGYKIYYVPQLIKFLESLI